MGPKSRIRFQVIIICLWVLLFSNALYLYVAYMHCEPKSYGCLYCSKLDTLSVYFADNIRGHIFAGFLALGGFLLSLKTFIVVTMKDKVYDTDGYSKLWQERFELDSSIGTKYAPLSELSDLLYYAIAFSIAAAVAQMTLGLFNNIFATALALYLAAVATILLIKSLTALKKNLERLFEIIEHNNSDTGNR
jgi:hypothetical protein